MSALATPERLPAPRAADAIALPRRHVVALAVLICIPVPLLSLGATVVPLPGLVERAVATFVPFVAPALGEDEGRIVRQRAVALRALEIRLHPSEVPGTVSGQDSSAPSSLEAPKTPRSRAPGAQRSLKPNQRPKTGYTAGGSTAGGSTASLPGEDDPRTGGSSGESSGGSGGSSSGSGESTSGSGESSSGGSGGSSSGGSGGSGSGGSGGSGSGGSGKSGSGGSGKSGSGGSGGAGSGSGSGGSGSAGSTNEHPAPPTPPTPPTGGGSGGSGGSGGDGSGGSGPGSTKDKPNK